MGLWPLPDIVRVTYVTKISAKIIIYICNDVMMFLTMDTLELMEVIKKKKQ